MYPIPHAIALICTGLFAGGAMMQSIVDHPARLAADSVVGIDQMQRSLLGADPYMPLLAIGGSGAALWSFLAGGGAQDVVAAVILVAVIPLTWAFILPINRRIHAYRPGQTNAAAVLEHMRRWASLHALRSLFGTIALVLLATGDILAAYVR